MVQYDLRFSIHCDSLRRFLGIRGTEDDALLERLWAVGVELADQVVDGEGRERTVPFLEMLWLYRYVDWRYWRSQDRQLQGWGPHAGLSPWGDKPDMSLLVGPDAVRV